MGMDLPGFEVNLPLIGKTYLGPPKVGSIWEALGFTATSNNEARQKTKMAAIEKARISKKGVKNGPGAEIRAKWLEKYGYPRLVGSGGIFYADQLSTDKEPMGGFNMGKSGRIWPIFPNPRRSKLSIIFSPTNFCYGDDFRHLCCSLYNQNQEISLPSPTNRLFQSHATNS